MTKKFTFTTEKKSPLGKITKWLLIFSFAVLLFGGGYRLGEYQTQKFFSQAATEEFDFRLFWETKRLLEKKFVDQSKLDDKTMFFGAIKGLVASTEDPYTFFLTPDENKQSKDDLEGKFDGIGAQLGLKNHAVVVIAPLKESPAEKAGIRAGDVVLKVDDHDVRNWNLFETVSAIRGEKGSTVKLKILRGEEEMDFEIIRDTIEVESVELTFEPRVAILKLNRFGDNTQNEWDKAVQQIAVRKQSGEIDGMVLDLRDNPGGFLHGAIYIAAEFLPQNELVVTQEYSDGRTDDYRVDRPGKLTNIPLVVLVNEGSASASEIVAGALKDHSRAKLIGKKSFGKGSIQEALDLSDGAGLHVTIAKWILPKGAWINEVGVEPDVDVANEIPEGDSLSREIDKQLDTAIQTLINSVTARRG